MKRFLLSFLFASALLAPAHAQKLPAFVTDSLDSYIARALKKWNLPGMAVAIVKDGKVVVAKGYGVREQGKPEKVDENTLFMIASCTKAFTATSLCMLEQEKKLSLDQKVTTLLPYFRLKDSLASRDVAVRDLLCHRLGLETFQGDFVHWDSNLSRQEVAEQLAKYEPQYGFRTHFGYCNAAFTTAGLLIPEATEGLYSWDAFVSTRLLLPLAMTRTSTSHAALMADANASRPHSHLDGKEQVIPYDNVDNLGPAGSINSSVNDLAHWIQMQLDSGRYGGKQIVPFSALEKTRTPQIAINNLNKRLFPSTHFSEYGLGWFLRDFAGRKIIWHDGGASGFLSNVTIVPEENLGFVILTNSDNNAIYEALHYQLLDAFFGQPWRNYSDLFCKQDKANEKKNDEEEVKDRALVARKKSPPLPLSTFTGDYTNPDYGKVTLKEKNGVLLMTLEHHPTVVGVLEYRDGNTFLCTFSSPVFGTHVLPFEIADKKVLSMTVTVNDYLDFMPYKFTKMTP